MKPRCHVIWFPTTLASFFELSESWFELRVSNVFLLQISRFKRPCSLNPHRLCCSSSARGKKGKGFGLRRLGPKQALNPPAQDIPRGVIARANNSHFPSRAMMATPGETAGACAYYGDVWSAGAYIEFKLRWLFNKRPRTTNRDHGGPCHNCPPNH